MGSSKRGRGVLKVQASRHIYDPDGYELGVYAVEAFLRELFREE